MIQGRHVQGPRSRSCTDEPKAAGGACEGGHLEVGALKGRRGKGGRIQTGV